MQKLFDRLIRRPGRRPLSERSDWAQLPTELLVLVAGYASFRGLLSLALVNDRLYQLVHQTPSSVSCSANMWSCWPSVKFTVEVVASGRTVDERSVLVNGDRFDWTNRSIEYVTSMLSVLRHVIDLRLIFIERGSQNSHSHKALENVPDLVFSVLRHFSQLRSLYVQGVPYKAANTFASALDAMPSLCTLELRAYEMVRSEQLTAALYRLCSKQLDHLTLSQHQLYHLIHHRPNAPMTHLQSLTAFLSVATIHDKMIAMDAAGQSRLSRFPSLLRLHVSCGSHLTRVDFPGSGSLVDWANLLTASSPPVFALRLTHLAIRLHLHDTTAAAASLPSLPAMYPSLTHVHVGMRDAFNGGVLATPWDAAVQAVRTAVGSAWCESEDDVVPWGQDVA